MCDKLDTVDRNILLYKLFHYGKKRFSQLLVFLYLSSRKQFVTIDGFDSETQSLVCTMWGASWVCNGYLCFI